MVSVAGPRRVSTDMATAPCRWGQWSSNDGHSQGLFRGLGGDVNRSWTGLRWLIVREVVPQRGHPWQAHGRALPPEATMSRPAGNTRLKSARVAAGYNSQQALA